MYWYYSTRGASRFIHPFLLNNSMRHLDKTSLLNKPSVFILLLSALGLVAGCSKTNEEALLLEANYQELCTQDTISFHEHVAPIIAFNCMPCHNASQASGTIVLETYADISGLAASGTLLGVVRHEPGFLQMPKDKPKLRECEIRALEVWVNQGTLNN